MKTKEVSAMRISRQIHGIEDKVDLLLADVAGLMSEMTHFRVDTDMDANIGQRAIARVADIQGKLVEARMRAVGAHSDMKKIMETTADIPITCPEDGSFRFEEVRAVSVNE